MSVEGPSRDVNSTPVGGSERAKVRAWGDHTSVTDLPAHVLSDAIRSREVSCREVMQATLARIQAANPTVNAIVSLRDGDALLREADERDAQLRRNGDAAGWMHGMPQAIKDAVAIAGLRTTFGSPLLRDNVPTEDALMVQRMKAAGCIVIGKTNTPEFGLGSHTFNEVFGVTRNAYDRSKAAGVSSGGAAVALATRMLAVADGSDFMGSLRNPAAEQRIRHAAERRTRAPLARRGCVRHAAQHGRADGQDRTRRRCAP